MRCIGSLRLASYGALDCGETELQADKIIAGGDRAGALLFDCAKQFQHRSREAVREPAALQPWRVAAQSVRDGDGLLLQVGPDADRGGMFTDHDRAVLTAMLGPAIEHQTGLRAIEFHQNVGCKIGFQSLARNTIGCRKDVSRRRLGQQATQDVKPMDRKVVQNEMLDSFKWGPRDPRMIPVDGQVSRMRLP